MPRCQSLLLLHCTLPARIADVAHLRRLSHSDFAASPVFNLLAETCWYLLLLEKLKSSVYPVTHAKGRGEAKREGRKGV